MKNIKIIIPVVLLLLGGVYKFALAKPAPVPKHKIEGEVYILQKDFLINLKSGRFAKLNAALVLHHGYLAEAVAAVAGGGHGAAPPPPTGYGTLPQEAVVRAIITDELTDISASKLEKVKSREKVQKHVLERIHKETDVHAEDVMFTDLAIQ